MRRCVIALVLGALGAAAVAAAQEPTFEQIVAALENPDPTVRIEAIRRLDAGRRPEAVAPLARLIVDPVDDVQLAALAAELNLFFDEPISRRRRVALVVEVRTPSRAQAAFERGPLDVVPRAVPRELIGSLVGAAQDDNPSVRLEALYALGVLVTPPADSTTTDRLIATLQQGTPAERLAAARVLGRLRASAAGEALIHAINDPDDDVRLAAMRAVGLVGEARGVQALTEQFLYYQHGPPAEAAFDGLARLGDRGSSQLFRQHLRNSDPAIRALAAEGLGRLGDASVAPELESAMQSERSPDVVLAMTFALQKLGRPYVDHVVSTLAHPERSARAAQYLTELGPSIQSDLERHLQSADASIRAGAARVLGMIGSPSATSALEAVRRDADPDVVSAADRALERIRLAGGAAGF